MIDHTKDRMSANTNYGLLFLELWAIKTGLVFAAVVCVVAVPGGRGGAWVPGSGLPQVIAYLNGTKVHLLTTWLGECAAA